MKTRKKIWITIAVLLVLMPAIGILVIQLPSVQTKLCQKVVNTISEKVDGEISIGNVYLAFPDRIILKDIQLRDSNNETIFASGKVSLAVKFMSLINGEEIVVQRAGLADGEFNFVTFEDGTSNIGNIFAAFAKKDKDNSSDSISVNLKHFYLENFAFSMINRKISDTVDVHKSSVGVHAMDFNDLHISEIDLNAKRIKYSDGKLSLDLEHLQAKEIKGFNLKNLNGEITYDSTGVRIDNLNIEDDYSNINAAYLSLGLDDKDAFSDFLNKVTLGADFNDAVLDFRTLQCFTSGIDFLTLCLTLNGEVTGPVSNLKVNGLSVQTETGGTDMELSAHISGLPDIMETMVGISINKCITSTPDIEHIINQCSSKPLKTGTISNILSDEIVSFTGTLNGFFTDFVAFGKLETQSSGSVNVDAIMRSDDETRDYEIIGFFDGKDIDLGKIANSDKLGTLTFDGSVAGTTGPSGDNLELEALTIREINFNGYTYKDIVASGLLDDTKFEGQIVSDDPNLDFDFHGTVGFPKDNEDALYRFSLNLDNADLFALHLDKRDVARIRLNAEANFTKRSDNDIIGEMSVKNLTTELEDGQTNIGDIHVNAKWSDSNYDINLNSSFITALFEGSSSITEYISDLTNGLAYNELSNLSNKPYYQIDSTHRYKLDIKTLDLSPILKFIMPSIYIANGTSISSSVNNGKVGFEIKSDLIAFKQNYIKGLNINANNDRSITKAFIQSDILQSGNIISDGNEITLTLDNNDIDLTLNLMNNSDTTNAISLHTLVSFLDKTVSHDIIKASLLESNIVINNDKWTVKPSELLYQNKHLTVNNFGIENGKQNLKINGILSDNPDDKIEIKMNEFNLGLINLFMNNGISFGGTLSGNGSLFGFLGANKGLLLNVNGNDLFFCNKEFGTITLNSNWNADKEPFDFSFENKLGTERPIQLTGNFRPEDKNLSINARIDKFDVSYLNPIAEGTVSNLNGTLSTTIKANGPLDNLKITSRNNRISNLGFVLDFTQVPYILNGSFTLSEDGFSLRNATVKDTFGHSGTVEGGISMEKLKNPRLNLMLDVINIHGLNTTSADSDSFFGKAFATGKVTFGGPFDKLNLDIDITTNQNSAIHIPLSSAASTKSSMLTFTNSLQSIESVYDSLVTRNAQLHKSNSSLLVHVKVDATPDAEINLDINEAVGDAIKARGNGLIDISVAPDVFDIKGVYNITEGSYKLVLLGLVSRDFNIESGGTINFNGDIMQSDLNLVANYRTKASMSTLIADMNTRRNVDCNIGITGKLVNPELSFDIQIPDLDPTSQSIVESTMNTEEKRLKQMLTLLISGGFMPDEQSGIVNNTTVLFSNASEIMANQINNVFRQLEIPLDLGFNYQPGDNGRDIFDVAVSTQLFNNRVTINGNIGNSQSLGASKSDIVGDIDMEIKLINNGKLRLTLFSHSADEYSTYLDQSQRNGAGIAYQEEFDTFKELWQKLFWSKERKNEAEIIKEREIESNRINFIN